ncbi:hypothetical protein JCM13580A_04370 [Streptomyces drozdowiczii]
MAVFPCESRDSAALAPVAVSMTNDDAIRARRVISSVPVRGLAGRAEPALCTFSPGGRVRDGDPAAGWESALPGE